MSETDNLAALRAALLEQMPGGGGSRNRINRDRINGLVDAALADARRDEREQIASRAEGWYLNGRLTNRGQIAQVRAAILGEEVEA